MSALRAFPVALIACCIGLFRLAIFNTISLASISALLFILCVATLLLLAVVRYVPQSTCLSAAAGSIGATLAGWFIVPSLVFLLLLAPFPARWGLLGTWTTIEEVQGKPAIIQREFSPFGTSTSYLDGEVRSTGHYVFIDDSTIQVDWRSVPRRFTVGSQRDIYNLQVDGDTLTMVWTLTKEATVFHRGATP